MGTIKLAELNEVKKHGKFEFAMLVYAAGDNSDLTGVFKFESLNISKKGVVS